MIPREDIIIDLTNFVLDSLNDVTITSPLSGDVIVYDSESSTWINQSIVSVISGSFYTKVESDALFSLIGHTHDDRYYTESESDGLFETSGAVNDHETTYDHDSYNEHLASGEIHRRIDDTAYGPTDLWSAQQISGELYALGLYVYQHDHDDRYYTEAEIDKFLNDYLPLSGGTMLGEIDMNDYRIINLHDPVDNQDAVTKVYVDDLTSGLATDVAANTVARHNRLHDITNPLDHTSSGTPDQILMADANGLPVDATNTDAAVAGAVTHAGGDGSDHADVATNTVHSSGDGSDHADVATNTTHKSSNGSDHTYIDQDVTSGSSPTFDGANFTGVTHTGGQAQVYFGGTCYTGTLGYILSPRALTISKVYLYAVTAPTGADLRVDIEKNGTTIFTTDGYTEIAAGDNSANEVPEVTSVSEGDRLEFIVEQVGSTVAGADLMVTIAFAEAANSVSFYIPGTAVVGTNLAYQLLGCAKSIAECKAYAITAPTDADMQIDVNKNGTTVFSLGTLDIADGDNAATDKVPGTTALEPGDRLSVDIDQVGSTVAGADVMVTVVFK